MTIRYLADMHFDHDSIIAYDNRPFDSVEEMNEALIANWNRVVIFLTATRISSTEFCRRSR